MIRILFNILYPPSETARCVRALLCQHQNSGRLTADDSTFNAGGEVCLQGAYTPAPAQPTG
jgi:hypothetical protein